MLDTVSKYTQARTPAKKKLEGVGSIQRLAVCASCGTQVLRDANQHGRERWYCPSCKSVSTKATDEALVRKTKNLLNYLTANPNTVFTVESSTPECTEAFRLENELDRELDKPEYNEDAARTLALALAAAQYAQLSAEDYETERLRRLFGSTEPCDTLNAGLLKKTVSAILVHPDGEVSLKLKNGQIIERSAYR